MIEVTEAPLAAWVESQRWFGAKSREVAHFTVLESVTFREDVPQLVTAFVEVRFAAGTHEIYQVPLGRRPTDQGWTDGVVEERDGWTVYDALRDPELALALHASIRAGDEKWGFHAVRELPVAHRVRAVGVEQSNSSLVFDETTVLKLYRRIGPGENPELELLRFLTAHGFQHIAPLAGWYEIAGRTMDATLGVLQDFVPGGQDGWALALQDLPGFLPRVEELGTVTGEMHSALGSDAMDPDFAPEQPSVESLALLTATIDEEIERIFLELPDDEVLGPIAHRGEEVRERLRGLGSVAAAGRVIRHHGDLHLGQVLLGPRGWVVLDFEGEPARSLTERRRKRSPLRDVAGMLRSFAYAEAATPGAEGWGSAARERFLPAYFEAVDAALLPPSQSATHQLLAIFELEKAVYELRYELDHRPDWAPIPVAAIVALLEVEA